MGSNHERRLRVERAAPIASTIFWQVQGCPVDDLLTWSHKYAGSIFGWPLREGRATMYIGNSKEVDPSKFQTIAKLARLLIKVF